MFLGRPHSLSILVKLDRKSLPTHESVGPYEYGTATRHFKDCHVTITGPWPPYHFMPGKLRTVSGGN
jgi:hypothetical protein